MAQYRIYFILVLSYYYYLIETYFFSEVGNNRALEQAKSNLINYYLLVGLSDQMRDFIELLELLLPSFFHGALENFDSLDGWL